MMLTAPTPTLADPATVTYHRKRMTLWPTSYLHEEQRVIDAAEAMAGLDNHEYPPEVVHNSAVDLASQRQAINDILAYRERRGVDVPPPTYGIPRPIIDEIKARRPIESEVELLTHLRRSGDSCRGICPICPGRSNPSSLAVWPERDSWHCFRCSIGGDVIQWVMATRGDDFPEAMRYLADVSGVTLPDPRQVAKTGRI